MKKNDILDQIGVKDALVPYKVKSTTSKRCGDVVYLYEYYTYMNRQYIPNYSESQLSKIVKYRSYVSKTEKLIRERAEELERDGLPTQLSFIFILPPHNFGVLPPSENSLSRSKRRLRDLIYSNVDPTAISDPKIMRINKIRRNVKLPLFVTLTYREPKFSPLEVKNDFKTFMKRLNYHLNTTENIRYIAVPEKHQSVYTQANRFGSYHYHMLVFDISFIDNKQLTEIWGHGFTYIKETYGSAEMIAHYVCKYLTKDLSIDCGHRFLISRNIKRPVVSDDLSTLPTSNIS